MAVHLISGDDAALVSSTLSDLVVSFLFTRPAVLLLARTGLMNRPGVLGVRRPAVTEGTA